jgi:hypothetical protein
MTKQPSGAIVTTTYRYKPPTRRKKGAPLAGPAVVTRRARVARGERNKPSQPPPPPNDDEKPSPKQPAIVTTASRKQLKLERVEQRAQDAEAREVSLEVKAFFTRMIRSGGSLPPEKR